MATVRPLTRWRVSGAELHLNSTPIRMSNIAYRPDIDGLRALAVVSVLIFHAFPSVLPGGFVGVDVFFVISGFLISSIIFKEIDSGTFSFTQFYARRIKRIFPALITVLISSYVFGWFYLFNEDFRRLGSHILRAAVFLSNFILWREAGYFDNAAETKPLLHLWSLGIEEQFYIVWPLILWIFWRFKTARWHLMVTATVSSFAWNMYQAQVDLTHDFYSPLTRFWELSSGATLAFYLKNRPSHQTTAPLISTLALIVLVGAVCLISSDKSFPGAWALLPVLGAVLLIYASPHAHINKTLFSNRIAISIGIISYPLYLWHWPILAFARIVEGSTPSVTVRLGALLLSVVLAWLTYLWIEKPIRFGFKSDLKTPLLVLVMGVVGYVGLACKNAGGYPTRAIMQSQTEANAGDIGHDAFHAYYAANFFPCADVNIREKSEKWGNLVRCFQTQMNAPIDLVIIGDSHAEHLLLGLAQALPHLNIAVYPRSELPFTKSAEYIEIFHTLVSDPKIKDVLITAMWAVAPLSSEERADFNINLKDTVQLLTKANKNVFLISDTPKFGFDPQRCKYDHPLSGHSNCSESKASMQKIEASYLPILERVVSDQPLVHLLQLNDVFCDETVCHMAKDGQILFRDNNHVNINGSRLLGLAVANKLKLAKQAAQPQ